MTKLDFSYETGGKPKLSGKRTDQTHLIQLFRNSKVEFC
jgi:hypothetical protein